MRLKRGSLQNIKLIVLYFNIFILTACFGIKSSPNPANEDNLENLNKRLNQHAEQIAFAGILGEIGGERPQDPITVFGH